MYMCLSVCLFTRLWCLYVHVLVCLFVNMSGVCVCVLFSVCLFTHLWCVCAFVCACLSVCGVYVYYCLSVCLHVCLHVCGVCVYFDVLVCLFVYIFVYIYVVCVCLFLSVCLFTCLFTCLWCMYVYSCLSVCLHVVLTVGDVTFMKRSCLLQLTPVTVMTRSSKSKSSETLANDMSLITLCMMRSSTLQHQKKVFTHDRKNKTRTKTSYTIEHNLCCGLNTGKGVYRDWK